MQKYVVKNFIFWFILILLPVFFVVILTLGWYTYGKLTYVSHFCSKFSKIDGEIGWVHKPNIDSCMGTHKKFNREKVYHQAKIYTDNRGFRSFSKGENWKKNAVMFLGDSFTFSYMLPFEDSFPAIFSDITKEKINNLGSPAYSGAQALALASRWLPELKPKAIVYFETGFWERGVCFGKSRPKTILKPCYWINAKGDANLILPVPGYTERMSGLGISPGGMVGAGENTWVYFLVSRPITKLKQILVRMGFISGMPHDFRFYGEDPSPVLKALVIDLISLAKQSEAKVVLIDTIDIYGEIVESLSSDNRKWLEFISYNDWKKQVLEPSLDLPKELVQIPHDGHYGEGMNELIAKEIARRFEIISLTEQ